MATHKFTLSTFKKNALQSADLKAVKAGYKSIPGIGGGVTSTGYVDWGEIEIRATTDLVLQDQGTIGTRIRKGGTQRSGLFN